MIKAICYDLDGVYFTPEGKKAFHQAVLDLGVDEERVEHVLYKSPEMRKFVTGKMKENDFWDFVREYWNLDKTNEEFAELWTAAYEVDHGVRKVVLDLRGKGYKSCILSNNNPTRVRKLQEKFGFLDDFDVVVFSYQVGFHKPQKEVFEALIEKSGCEPDEIVYADDNPERIAGAKELGMNVFVYENFQQFLDELKKLGVDV